MDSQDPRERPLPLGVVTFLLTDIEGSTGLFMRVGNDAYKRLLADHHRLVRTALGTHGGAEVKTEGDAFIAAFDDPARAVHAALAAQKALRSHPWPDGSFVRVRMGLHQGEVELGEGRDYVALSLHQAARVAGAPHGGQIIATEAVAVAASGAGVEARDLGLYWLKDFPEPVTLHAIGHEDASLGERAPRVPRADMSNVKGALSAIIGRDAEVHELARLLGESRLVTVVGPGGIGKTRLVMEVAADHAASRAEVWVVELATVSSDEGRAGVVSAIARALSITAPSSASLVRQIAGSPMLLVLDNAEHLIADVGDLVDELQSGCPALRILTTSREPLAVDGEIVLRLPPLTVPDVTTDRTTVAETTSVQLFVSRAQARHRSFGLTAGNWMLVAELCRELDGIPLALEIAAARVGTLGPQALLDRLRKVGDLPGDARRGRGRRHTTLNTVLDWSLSLCSPTEVAVLRRMGVFGGAVSLRAVLAVCRGDAMDETAVVDALAALVDKSLVVAHDGPEPSYDLLVTVRTAAFTRLLATGEREEAVLRHARWVLDELPVLSAEEPRDATRWVPFAPELFLALERAADGALPLDVFVALTESERLALIVAQPERAIRYGLAIGRNAEVDDRVRGRALIMAGSAHDTLGEQQLGQVLAREALELGRRCADPMVTVGALTLLIAAVEQTGTLPTEEGEQYAAELRLLMEKHDLDTASLAIAHHTVGLYHLARGQLEQARRYFVLSRENREQTGRDYNHAAAIYNIAEVDEKSGDLGGAATGYLDAATALRDIHALGLAAMTFGQAAALLLELGRTTDALEAGSEAVLAARRARNIPALAHALDIVAQTAEAAGDTGRAAAARSEAGELAA